MFYFELSEAQRAIREACAVHNGKDNVETHGNPLVHAQKSSLKKERSRTFRGEKIQKQAAPPAGLSFSARCDRKADFALLFGKGGANS